MFGALNNGPKQDKSFCLLTWDYLWLNNTWRAIGPVQDFIQVWRIWRQERKYVKGKENINYVMFAIYLEQLI